MGTTIADNVDVVQDEPPALRTYDREGNVVNEVSYHPAHLENERLTYEAGCVADAFRTSPDRDEPLSLTYNLAAGYLLGMVDIGLACPFAMTAGAALVLDEFSDHDGYFETLTAREYDDLATGAPARAPTSPRWTAPGRTWRRPVSTKTSPPRSAPSGTNSARSRTRSRRSGPRTASTPS